MAKYRKSLPQLSGAPFLSDAGMETMLIFREKIELRYFATIDLLKDESKCEWVKNYYHTCLNIARKYGVGFILETATWRASPDWIHKLGYSDRDVTDLNRKAVQLLDEIRNEYESDHFPIVISGCVGPRGDGYITTTRMTIDEAQAYHAIQIGVLSQTQVDMITAYTLNYPEEAIGIVQAAKAFDLPVVISFTIETDGKLPSGHSLKEAIEMVDTATGSTPAYYMMNCAYPNNFADVISLEESWTTRIRGVRGNGSKKSHAELDESIELDSVDPVEFGMDNRALLDKLKNLNVFGGCCGTEYQHLEEICKACITTFNQRKTS